MKPSTRVIDRLVAGLVGLVLLAGGLWALGYRLGQRTATDATHRVSTETVTRLPDEPWWPPVIGAAGVVLILGTLWLLVRHLRSASTRTVPTEGGGTVDLGRVADAAAADVARSPLIRRARPSTVVEKGRPIIRIAVGVSPDASVEELSALAAAARREVTAATNPDVGFQLLVNDRRGDKRLGERPREEEHRTISERT
ncbi:alkaline shock response membrane anchor protein AmaP [Tsukamurella sputi]|uniref:alkaline shock response membrane anchor protein AmaP n=1 Tax=Tsukamurella sputi TaxID=2591848 RepID=UPI001877D130|nr:alkaline shock response membrane anchor protein AmaP [Tsukamurella sputi]